MSYIDKQSALRTVDTVLEAAGLKREDLFSSSQTWHLDEDAADSLRQFIGDSEPSPITLSVGRIVSDDNTELFGLRCWNSEYPEEGAILLTESERPAPTCSTSDDSSDIRKDLENQVKILTSALKVAKRVIDLSQGLTMRELDAFVEGLELVDEISPSEAEDPPE